MYAPNLENPVQADRTNLPAPVAGSRSGKLAVIRGVTRP
jgi:hypothetical protein